MPSLLDVILSGERKQCEHVFNKFQLYKWERKINKQGRSKDSLIRLYNMATGYAGYTITKRWIADCPVCGKLWLADSNKNTLLKYIKMMGKGYAEVLEQESIRYGKKPTQ
ncbi:MAG: hypothetical protein ACYDEI_00325 [Erysipelotrichaceae bacterium]